MKERKPVLIKEKAYAKINISLDVTGRRQDGYHDMVMIMQTVSLCDELTISPGSGEGVTARSNLRFIPGDERNLAVKAAMKYLEAVGERDKGVSIDIRKNIPVGAGMGGGSADAAAVLRAMNRAYEGRLSEEELVALASNHFFRILITYSFFVQIIIISIIKQPALCQLFTGFTIQKTILSFIFQPACLSHAR